MIVLVAFLFAAPVFAQETVGGRFYADCRIADGAATTIVPDNHIRMNLAGAAVKPDDAYRTAKQVFEGESQTMQVSLCDAKMEVQGDSESIEGHMVQFKAVRDKDKAAALCN